MQNVFDSYFHGHSHDLSRGCGHASDNGHKENFKETFYHQKYNNMRKREKKNVKIMSNKMRI